MEVALAWLLSGLFLMFSEVYQLEIFRVVSLINCPYYVHGASVLSITCDIDYIWDRVVTLDKG